MKVLMLSWEFPPSIIGGLGVVVRDIAKFLLKKGVDIKVVLPYNPHNHEKIFEGKLLYLSEKRVLFTTYDSFEYIKESIRGKDFISLVEQYKKLCVEKCTNIDFDIIHAHDWLTFPAGVALKKITGKKLIVHIHSTEFDRAGGGRGNEVVHSIEYEGLKEADKIIAVSNLVKTWIVKEYGIDESKIKVIHNAIDYSANITNIPLKSNEREFVVLYVGRISWMKGVDILLQAAKKVLDYDKEIRFLIVGSGEMLPKLIEEASALGIADRVLFTGKVRREDLHKYYASSDVLVIPSRSEPYGLIALEGAYHYLPIIISNQSGASEVLSHALRYDHWDVDKLVEYILCLKKHHPLKKELSMNVASQAKNVNWDDKTEEIINLYKEVL